MKRYLDQFKKTAIATFAVFPFFAAASYVICEMVREADRTIPLNNTHPRLPSQDRPARVGTAPNTSEDLSPRLDSGKEYFAYLDHAVRYILKSDSAIQAGNLQTMCFYLKAANESVQKAFIESSSFDFSSRKGAYDAQSSIKARSGGCPDFIRS